MVTMCDPKTTLTGSGIAIAWVLAFVLKHYAGIAVPDEVTYGIVALGFMLLGKFSKDSTKVACDTEVAAQLINKGTVDAVTKVAP